MLVSKIKPCMSQYKLPYGETANGSLKQLSLIRWLFSYMDTSGNPRANTCAQARLQGRAVFISYRADPSYACNDVIDNHQTDCTAPAGSAPFEFLTYQLPTVWSWLTVAMTGNGELGFDSGEGA